MSALISKVKAMSAFPTIPQSTDQAIQIFSSVYGQIVWSVRSDEYHVLTLDFGAPHLKVYEPVTRTRKTQDGSPLLITSRVALPEGQWHLFVYDGDWRVEAGGYACARTDESPLDQRAFAYLDGQKLTSVSCVVASGEWLFDFEFGGKLSIKPALPYPEPEPDPPSHWVLFFEAGGCLYCEGDGRLFLGE